MSGYCVVWNSKKSRLQCTGGADTQRLRWQNYIKYCEFIPCRVKVWAAIPVLHTVQEATMVLFAAAA